MGVPPRPDAREPRQDGRVAVSTVMNRRNPRPAPAANTARAVTQTSTSRFHAHARRYTTEGQFLHSPKVPLFAEAATSDGSRSRRRRYPPGDRVAHCSLASLACHPRPRRVRRHTSCRLPTPNRARSSSSWIGCGTSSGRGITAAGRRRRMSTGFAGTSSSTERGTRPRWAPLKCRRF